MWRDDLQLPDAEEALRDPESFRIPERGDRAYAALAAITAAVLADNTSPRWKRRGARSPWHAGGKG